MSQVNEKFEREIASVVNKHGVDNECGVPDYIIAAHVAASIRALRVSVLALRAHEGSNTMFGIDRTTGPSVWRGTDNRITGHAVECPTFRPLGGDCTCSPEEETPQ